MPRRGTGDYLSAEKDLGEYFKKPSIEGVYEGQRPAAILVVEPFTTDESDGGSRAPVAAAYG